MPDEAPAAPAEAQDTPTPDAPADLDGQGAPPTPDDAQQGYLRHSDYTRKTQELAEQRKEWETQQADHQQFEELVRQATLGQDEEAAQQLLERLGYEFDDEDDDYGESQDPQVAALKGQIDELTSWREQQEQDAAARQNAMHVESEFHRLTGESWDESNPSHDAILALAFAHDTGEGPTNVESGYKAFEALRDSIIENYKQGKYNAPPAPENGSPAAAASNENMSLEDKIRHSLEQNFPPVT